MTARDVLLKSHLYLGFVAAVFLVILGVTGTIMAFEADIDRWVHPALWYVTVGARTLPESDLICAVEQRFAPARVAMVQVFRQANVVRMMQLTNQTSVFVNPYNASIQGTRNGPSRTNRVLGVIHQIHLRLAPDPRSWGIAAVIGKVVISIAGLILCLLVPTGLILWWRTKRASIKWKSSWFRICFDAHHAVGLYAALFLFVAAFTGVLIGFDFPEEAIYAMTHSSPPSRERPPQSTPIAGGQAIAVDQAIEIARREIPEASLAGMQLPLNPKGTFNILLRVPEETSEAVHSSVLVDQFSGKVLQVRNFKTDSLGYRVIRFNRSIHTGDVLGTPTHIVVSLSSLLLVVMVITGLVIWWKKLAV